MSRCFPYPPPGYVKNGIRYEALIESIKLKREEQKARKDRKKEKKHEKKEERAREGGEVESKKRGHRKRHRDEKSQDPKGGDVQKRRETEVENNEKSSLTEEHGQTVGSQNSSDSTLNSNIRQKQSPPSDSSHNPGLSFRIKIPSQRHKDPALRPNKGQPLSTFGRISNDYVRGIDETAPISGTELGENPCSPCQNLGPRITLKLSKDMPCQSSCAVERFAGKAEATLASKLCSSCSPTLALQFKNLVADWIPPPLESGGFEDEDWLSQTIQNLQPMSKRIEIANVSLSQGNSTHWPHACHLPEVDMHALPFTVPF